MSKPSLIDKAIAKLEGEVAVRLIAIAELKEQQKAAPARRPRIVANEQAG